MKPLPRLPYTSTPVTTSRRAGLLPGPTVSIVWLTLFAVPVLAAGVYPQSPVRLLVAGGDDPGQTQAAGALARQWHHLNPQPLRVEPGNGVSVQDVIEQLSRARSSGQVLALVSHEYVSLGAPPRWQLLGVFLTAPTVCVVAHPGKGLPASMPSVVRLATDRGSLRVASGPGEMAGRTARLVLAASGLPPSVRLLLVTYRSASSAVAAVLKGAAGFACAPLPVVIRLLEQRQLSVVFTSSALPSRLQRGEPPSQVAGFAVLDAWYGVGAPTRVNQAVIAHWQQLITRTGLDPVAGKQAGQRGLRSGRDALQLRAQAQATLASRNKSMTALLTRYRVTDR